MFSLRKIARNYMCEGDFVIDFLSTVDVIGMFANLRKGQITRSEEMARDKLANALSRTACLNCGAGLSEMTAFNLMFSTKVGAGNHRRS